MKQEGVIQRVGFGEYDEYDPILDSGKIKGWDQVNDSYPNTDFIWELEKNDNEKFLNVLAVTVDQIKNIAIFIHPIMPDASIKILQILGISKSKILFKNMNAINLNGNKLSKVNHLFSRVQS